MKTIPITSFFKKTSKFSSDEESEEESKEEGKEEGKEESKEEGKEESKEESKDENKEENINNLIDNKNLSKNSNKIKKFIYSESKINIPDNMIDASKKNTFSLFKETLIKEENIIYFGVIYKLNFTSFRDPIKLKNDEDSFKTIENLVGFGFFSKKDNNNNNNFFFLPLKKMENNEENLTEDNISLKSRWEFIKFLFESKEVIKISYECQDTIKIIFQSLNIQVYPNCLYDIKIATWLINPEMETYDFEEILSYFLNKKQKESISSSNSQRLAKDLLDCSQLWIEIEKRLKKDNLFESFINQEMKIVPILAKMEFVGIAFDSNTLFNNKKKLQKRIEYLKKEADKIAGHPILLSSPQKVAHVLFNELKLQSPSKEKLISGYQSTGEKILQSLKDKHPLPAIILEFRHCQKLLSNWFDTLDKKAIAIADKKYPRIHTSWRQTNTATGRLASVNPNLQNLPKQPLSLTLEENEKNEKLTINIRDAFCCEPGNFLVSFDYSQIEMRILAHMSKDQYLLQFFKEGKDIHRFIASRWLGKNPDEITDIERDRAKRIVFGILYGMGPTALSGILNVSLHEASHFIESFLGKFIGVKKFIEDTIIFAKKNGYVTTLMNRRRLFPDINLPETAKRGERQAVNSVIQGSAADIVKIAMIEIDKLCNTHPLCKEITLLLQIHDELIFELPNNIHFDKILTLIGYIMENVIHLDVPLPVNINKGIRWGSLESINKNIYKEEYIKTLIEEKILNKEKQSLQYENFSLSDEDIDSLLELSQFKDENNNFLK